MKCLVRKFQGAEAPILKRIPTMRHTALSVLVFLQLLASCSPDTESGAASTNAGQPATEDKLTTIAAFEGVQVTGLTYSESGRLFANFPRWRTGLPFSVVEINADGSFHPYPDTSWNNWDGVATEQQFVCVQSVVAHGNALFVLDPSSPEFQGVVGSAKLYEFDLATDQLQRVYTFPESVAPMGSYLNDLRVDTTRGLIYLTDSNEGAIIVLDQATGSSRRLLYGHSSTAAEDTVLTINGKPWILNGEPRRIAADGIALAPDGAHLYYHALTGYHLYRIPTEALADPTLSADDLAAQVEDLGPTPAPDGMIFDPAGNLYLADLEDRAIVYRTPDGRIEPLIQDERVQWADTFTLGPNGTLYFTTSKIGQAGADISNLTFYIYATPLAP